MEAIKKMIENGQKVIVRTEHAGVFYGVVTEMEGQTVEVRNCRRIWYWDGAASLSELAETGPKKPRSCKFSVAVSSLVVMGVKEVIPCTEAASKAIEEVPVWRA